MSLKMAYYPYKQVLLSLIILSLINNFMQITNARYINLDINPKITLRFISGLPENSSVAKVRCQSKDDDLGDRTLNPGDQFDFSFRMNFFATTLLQSIIVLMSLKEEKAIAQTDLSREFIVLGC